MNRFIASNVVCCEPVASSPEAWVRPAGVSVANASGNAAGGVEEIGQRVADVLLVDVEAAVGATKLSSMLRKASSAS